MSKNRKETVAARSASARKSAPQPTTTAHKHKLAILALAAATVVVLLIVWLITSVAFQDDSKEPEATTPSEASSATPTAPPAKAGKNTPGGTVDDNRKKVLSQAVALLDQGVAVGKDGEGEAYQELLVSLQAGDFSPLPESFTSTFRFSDYLTDDELKAASYISVVHLSTLVNSAAKAQDKTSIEPLTDDAWKNVYVDMEAGQAFVPVTVFLGQDASFSLEFLYVNGEWKFVPYSLIDAIQAAERATTANTTP